MPAPLPSELLHAASEPGGRLALVLGAGCSLESPTDLQLASVYSESAHAQLVLDQVIHEGGCSAPSDLSALASAVYSATGSQVDLVRRLPRNDFRMARPNSGYLIAAALLREGVVNAVLTLNFDLAMTAALSELGAKEVAVVEGLHHALPRNRMPRSCHLSAKGTCSSENGWVTDRAPALCIVPRFGDQQLGLTTARIVPSAPADAPRTTKVRPHRECGSEVEMVKVPRSGFSDTFAAPRCNSTAPITLVNQPRAARMSKVVSSTPQYCFHNLSAATGPATGAPGTPVTMPNSGFHQAAFPPGHSLTARSCPRTKPGG